MDRGKIEQELRIIERLYGDGDTDADAAPLREQYPDLGGEIEAFEATKEALERRPKRRPDRRSVEAVLAEAAGDRVEAARGRDRILRSDRSARSRRSMRLRSAGVLTAFLVAFVGIYSVWQSQSIVIETSDNLFDQPTAMDNSQAPETGGDSRLSESDSGTSAGISSNARNQAAGKSAPSSSESTRRPDFETQVGAFDRRTLSSQYGGHADAAESEWSGDAPDQDAALIFAGQALHDDGGIAWDEGADLIEVHRQIEMIGGGVALGWDPPSVPLEMRPAFEENQDFPSSRLLEIGEPRRP